MRVFVQFAVAAAWICAVAATPVPSSRYSDSDGDQTVYTAEGHLFNDAAFPLRMRPHAQAFPGFPSEDSSRLFPIPVARDPPTYSEPFSGFFSDMQDMMKILRNQMTDVIAKTPDSSINHEERLRPSDVQNQTSTKVEYLDGHKVVINDTTYSNGDTKHGTIFHVQIIDLLPLDPDEQSVEIPVEDPAFAFGPGPGPAPAGPKTKISNDVAGGKARPEDRDREEVEDDDEETGEDFDETAIEERLKPKPAKKTDQKDTKDKLKEKEVKKVDKKQETFNDDDEKSEEIPEGADKKVTKEEEKGAQEEEKVPKEEEKTAKDAKDEEKVAKEEKIEKREDTAGHELEEWDEREGEDMTDMKKKVEQKKDIMDTAESRWQNEIDNRIDTYQPYYKSTKPNYNHFSEYYYEPYYKAKPNYNSYQPYYPDQQSYGSRQPVYNYEPTYKPEQPSYNNFESTYKPEQPSYNLEPAYKPEQPSYNNYQQGYNQPMYNAQPGYNNYDSSYKPSQTEYNYPKDNDRFMDLSSDIKVNDFMASQHQAGLVTMDPDAEFIDIDKKPTPLNKYPRYNYRKY